MADEPIQSGGQITETVIKADPVDETPSNLFNLKPGERPKLVRAQDRKPAGQKRDVPAPQQKQQQKQTVATEEPVSQATDEGFASDEEIYAQLESDEPPPNEQDPEDIFNDPELKDKPGAQKRIQGLLARTKEAEGYARQATQQLQQYDTALRQVQNNYQLAYNQNQQLREQVAGFQAQLDAMRRYGAKPEQVDEVEQFREQVLKQAEEKLNPRFKQYEDRIAAFEREKQEAAAKAQIAQRRTKFSQQGSAAAKRLSGQLHESGRTPDMEDFLAAQAIALAHGTGQTIDAAAVQLQKMLDRYSSARHRFLKGSLKTGENQKVSGTAKPAGRAAPPGRQVIKQTDALKGGYKDSLAAQMAAEGIVRAQ